MAELFFSEKEQELGQPGCVQFMAYTAAERLMNVMNNGLTVWLVLDAIALALRSIT